MRLRRAALALAGFALLPGAGSEGAQRNQDRLLAEIRQIQAQLATLTEAQATLTSALETFLDARESESAADRRSRADTQDSVVRMERDVAALGAALVEMNERLSGLTAEVASVREAQRAAAFASAPAEDEGEDATAADAGEGAEDAAPDEGPDPEGGDEADSGGVEVLDGPSIVEIYMQAQADYLQGRYELAIQGFQQVVERESEVADDARYFLGDALLARDELEPALDQFEMVIRDFPDSQRIGDAWVKRGVILRRLGHESDAREIFEDIVDVYAGTPAALAAQRELDAMGPPEPGA